MNKWDRAVDDLMKKARRAGIESFYDPVQPDEVDISFVLSGNETYAYDWHSFCMEDHDEGDREQDLKDSIKHSQRRKWGRGYTHKFTMSISAAKYMLEIYNDWIEIYSYQDDPETNKTSKKMQSAINKILVAIRKVES